MLFYSEQKKKNSFLKINEIRKALTVKESNKDYGLLIRLSKQRISDNFFDNVVVNDENQDIKKNRLELLKCFVIHLTVLLIFPN